MSRSNISEQELDHSNDVWRTTPLYQEALLAVGANPNGPIKLSEQQRQQLHEYVSRRGMVLPHGTEFDPAGNVNRDDRGFAESGLGKTLIAAGAFGASMLIPGVAPAVLGALGGGGGGAAATSGTLASSSLPAMPLATAIPGSVAGGAAGAAGAAGGGFGRIWDFIKGNGRDIAGVGGEVFGGLADSQAESRQARLDASVLQNEIDRQAETDFRQALINREVEGRTGETDAFRKSQVSGYVTGDKKTSMAPNVSPYHTPGSGVRAPGAEELAGATAMGTRANERLTSGNPIPMPERQNFTIDEDLLTPGGFEQVNNLVGGGFRALDALNRLRNRRG